MSAKYLSDVSTMSRSQLGDVGGICRAIQFPPQHKSGLGQSIIPVGFVPGLGPPARSIVIRYHLASRAGETLDKARTVEIEIPKDNWNAFVEGCMACLGNLIQGSANLHETRLRFCDIEMDLLRRRVVRKGRHISLSAKEFDLLEYFMRRPHRVLTREQIFERVWGLIEEEHSNTLEVHLSHLRKKLNVLSEKPLLQTVRGVGYVLSDEEY